MRIFSKYKLSGSNVLLLSICLVVIISILLMNILNSRNLSDLRSSIDTLSKPNTTIKTLHSTNQELLVAENKFRIYLSTGDTSYKKQFVGHINHIVSNLELVQHSEDSVQIAQVLSGLSKKIKLADAISTLKHLSDSVSNTLSNVSVNSLYKHPIRVEKINTDILKKYYQTDTLKAVAEKKGFFKKLGGLFSNKDDTKYKLVKGDSSATQDSTQSAVTATINNLSIDIQKFYQNSLNKELDIRRRLNESEKVLAETNLSIINQLNNALNIVLQKEEEQELGRNNVAILNASNARNSMQNLSWVSFIIILIIALILIYNIKQTIQYEKDILESRERAEKLAITKTRFLNNMSHEIRSPLTSIIGFTEQLESTETDEDKKKFLQAIHASSDHLLNTVNDVLDYSKLDAGKLMLEKEPFRIGDTIEEIIYSFTIHAEKKGIQLNSNLQIEKELRVMGDEFRLRQILFNLISNAIKFTSKGSVTVTASALWKSENEIDLKVEILDSGAGIPDDQLDMIFEEFAQATNNKMGGRRSIKGTGLGLPICKMLVEMQGGNITVQSEINKGSLFTVNIPYQVAQEEERSISSTVEGSSTAPSFFFGKKALIVEDNDMNILLLTLLLKKYFLDYDVAKDGETALDLFNSNKYDIVLTDINVPKLTGDQLAAAIRRSDDSVKCKLPIIALTASVIADDLDAYLKTGINDILIKPFKEADFKTILIKYLESKTTAVTA
ncbi:MAG: response regulator [Bacteroidota bacterium]|nr:response regulator [Bacteroidota bacterium]